MTKQRAALLAPARRVPTTYPKKQDKEKAAPAAEGGPLSTPLRGVRGAPATGEGVEERLTRELLALDDSSRERVLSAVLAAQALQGPQKTRELELWTDAVAEALVQALGGPGVAAFAPMVIKQTVGTRAAYGPVKRLCETIGLHRLTPARQMSAYRLLARLLIGYARQTKVPLSPKLLANCCANIAAVFEEQFPGYIQSGLGMLPFNLEAQGRAA